MINEDVVTTKCNKCKSKFYIRIFKNKINKLQIGLYCTRCNKWYKFINEEDVPYYVGCKCRVKNEYGNLYDTKLYQIQKYFRYIAK